MYPEEVAVGGFGYEWEKMFLNESKRDGIGFESASIDKGRMDPNPAGERVSML